MNTDEIRRLLRDWIRARGTQEEIAQKLDTTPASVSRWLSGDRPITLPKLDELLKAAGVDILTLVSLGSPDAGNSWQTVPVVALRSVPVMEKDSSFDDLVKAVESATKERVAVPFRESPALALRMPSDLAQFDIRAGELAVIVAPEGLEPGKPASIQVQGRTEIGACQMRRGKMQVAVEGHVYEEGEFILVGRVRGVWREF